MRRAGDRVADPRSSPPTRTGPGRRPLSAPAVRRWIGKLGCAHLRLCGFAHGNASPAGGGPGRGRPGVLRPERRASICPSPSPSSPHAASPEGAREHPLISHRAGRGKVPRSRKYLAHSLERGAGGGARKSAAVPRRSRPAARRGLVLPPEPPGMGPGTLRIASTARLGVLPTGKRPLDGGDLEAETGQRPAGSAIFSAAAQRAAIVLRRGSPISRYSGAPAKRPAAPQARVSVVVCLSSTSS
jgi:hypothetical protein